MTGDLRNALRFGTAGVVAISILVMCSTFISLNGNALTGPRAYFAMARDGLFPAGLCKVHPRFHTPHVVTWITGIAVAFAAAFLPVGQLADISNAGTLFAFAAVSLAVMVLRHTQPGRKRPFRTPWVYLFGCLSVFGCVMLFFFLPWQAQLLFPIWSAAGLVFYYAYGYRHSHVGRGLAGLPELDSDAPPDPLKP